MIVLPVMVTVTTPPAAMPPPWSVAELPLIVVLTTFNCPAQK